jgi:hypothetical protein
MFTSEVYQVDTRWAYAILENGWPIIRQEYHPDKPGDEPMTQEEAEECVAIVLTRVSGSSGQSGMELNKIDFLRLFTNEEIARLLEEAKTNPTVAVYQYKLSEAPIVRLNDPDILTGLPALEAMGFLDPGRAARILGNLPP